MGVRLISPGSLSFAKLVTMSSAPAKSAGDARYAFQFIQSTLSHTISSPICIRSVLSTSNTINIITSNNQRLGSAFDDLDPRLFAKLVRMSSVAPKSTGDARYAS